MARRFSRSGARSSSAPSRRKAVAVASHVEAQNALYAAPWILAVVIAILGQILFVLWGEAPWQWLTQVGMTFAVGCVAYAGWLNTKARTPLALGHTLVTILLTGIWLILCSETGWITLAHVSWADWKMPVLVHPTFDFFCLGALSLGAAWNMRQGIHAKEARDASLRDEVLDDWAEAGVPGVRGHLKKKNEYFLEGTLVLPKGETLQHLQHCARQIESSHDWPPNSLTLMPMPRHITSRRVKARVMLKDPLAVATNWPGVQLNPKQTLFDPIPEGMRADGVVSTVFVAKKEGAKHHLVQGSSGAGKSAGQKPILLTTAALDAVNIVIDTPKKTQTFGPLAPALHWLITEEGLAKAVIKRVAEVVIPARTEQLAREGLQQWSPKSSLKFLRLTIDEAWSLIESDELMPIAVAARSAGIQLVLLVQRASHNQIDTTVREQLGTRWCYGLGGHFGTMILDEEVIDAGANPVQWKDEQPGMHYLTRGGLSIEEKATPTRSFHDEGGITYAESAALIGPSLAEIDDITANAFGPLWANRITPVELVKQVSESVKPVTQLPSSDTVAPPTAHPSIQVSRKILVVDDETVNNGVHPKGHSTEDTVEVHDTHLHDNDYKEDSIVTIDESGKVVYLSDDNSNEPTIYSEEDLEPDVVVDMDEPITPRPPDRPPLQFGDQSLEKVSPEKLAEMMEARLAELMASNKQIITGGDFTQVILQSGWVRTMTYKYLERWTRDGLLYREEGSGWLIVRRMWQI